MAVATPVLERQTLQNQSADLSADELHNSQIKENYKRLINPELNINELRGRAAAPEADSRTVSARAAAVAPAAPVFREEEKATESPVQNAGGMTAAKPAQPYLVKNARADAYIFRADNPVNRRAATVEVNEKVADEEESEDLRPTNTTIQYKTLREQNKSAVKAAEEETHILGKREKIIIATFISVVIALFILVIVNSAVIAGLNSEIAAAEESVSIARDTLANIESQIQASISEESINAFAQAHGMVRG